MLVLLDENIPHRLRLMLEGHEARTVAFQGWAGLTNGALLRAADDGGFDVVITADQGIRHQQNRTAYRVALIVLSTNREDRILSGVGAILEALLIATKNAIVFVDLDE